MKKMYSFLYLWYIILLCVPIHIISIKRADLIIFSFDRPMQLWALLESIEKNIRNIGDIKVIYRVSSDEFAFAYDEVKKAFNLVDYVQQSQNPLNDFKTLTMQCLENCHNECVFFAVDDLIVIRPVDIDECINVLEATNSYGFYLRLGLNLSRCYSWNAVQPLPPGSMYNKQFFVWEFSQGAYDWIYPHSVDMCIFKKNHVIKHFKQLSFNTPNTLESRWAGLAQGCMNRCGVCYVQSPTINVPLNRVQTNYNNYHMNHISAKDLLSRFNEGFKIDIEPLQNFVNESAHMAYIPTFIERNFS